MNARRRFLARAGALGAGGLAARLGPLSILALDANAQAAGDYKALVCVFLQGGVVNPWLRRRTASWDRAACALADLGKFLIKVGGRPGIPLHVSLTAAEQRLRVHDTSRLWRTAPAASNGHTAPRELEPLT